MISRILAGEEPAEAPAYEDDLPLVIEALDPLAKPLDRVFTRAEVPALLPAVDSIAMLCQPLAQRQRRPVTGEEAGDDEDGLSVRRAARPLEAPAADQARRVPEQLWKALPAGRRSIVALPLEPLRDLVQRNSPPISSCSTGGSFTRPSAVWWFSSSDTSTRGDASAVLLSVCAKRTFPSLPR